MSLTKLASILNFASAPSLDMMSFRSKDRMEFITLFAQLTTALPAGYFGVHPYIYMTGGLQSGKSLVAEVTAKTLDDDYSLDDIINDRPSSKYFKERNECQTEASYHNANHNGAELSILFKSAVSFASGTDSYFTLNDFKKVRAYPQSLTILTGWTEERDIVRVLEKVNHKPSLIIDLGRRAFNDNEARTTRLAIIDPSLQNDESFQRRIGKVQQQFTPKASTLRL